MFTDLVRADIRARGNSDEKGLTYDDEMSAAVIFRRKIEEKIRAGFSAALSTGDVMGMVRLLFSITENEEATIDFIVKAAGNFPSETGMGAGPNIISRERVREIIEEEVYTLRSAIAAM